MSSTVWVKFINSKSGASETAEVDFIQLTQAIPNLSKVCTDLGVADINTFVDYTGASEAFAEDLEGAEVPKFDCLQLSDLVVTLMALSNTTSGSVNEETIQMLSECRLRQDRFDLATLEYIM